MFTRIKMWIVGAAGVVALTCVFLWKAYTAGFDSAETYSMEKSLSKIAKGQDVEKGIDGLSDSSVTERLRESGWVRE